MMILAELAKVLEKQSGLLVHVSHPARETVSQMVKLLVFLMGTATEEWSAMGKGQ